MTSKMAPYSFHDGAYTFLGLWFQLRLAEVKRNRYGGIDVAAELLTKDGKGVLAKDRGNFTLTRFRESLASETARRNSGDTLGVSNFLLDALIALEHDPDLTSSTPPPSFQPVQEFLRQVKPPGPQLVEGLIEAGSLYALASRPKVGKTILLLNLARAVAQGAEWLNRRVTPGRVCFLQLEDSPRTIKQRLDRMGGEGLPKDLLIHTAQYNLSAENYDATLRTVRGAALIICDPVIQASKVRDWNSQSEVRDALELWRQLARDSEAAVIVSNHHRKMEGEYGDQMAGSIQALATVDGVIEMFRSRTLEKTERRVAYTGREWPDQPDEVIVLDPETYTWLYKGHLDQVRDQAKADKKQEDAQRALSVLPDSPPGVTLVEWQEQSGLDSKRLHAAREMLGSEVGSQGKGRKGDPLRFWRAE